AVVRTEQQPGVGHAGPPAGGLYCDVGVRERNTSLRGCRMGPVVSVVMPVRDGAALLPRAIESVRAQTFDRWELLVTDAGSADGTAKLLATYAAADPRVRVFTHSTARGVSAARNSAIREARARWVAYLDHDDEYYPGYLAAVDRWRDRGDVLISAYDRVEERPGHPRFGRSRAYEP